VKKHPGPVTQAGLQRDRQLRAGATVILAAVALWQSVSTTESIGRLVELHQPEVELVRERSPAEQK